MSEALIIFICLIGWLVFAVIRGSMRKIRYAFRKGEAKSWPTAEAVIDRWYDVYGEKKDYDNVSRMEITDTEALYSFTVAGQPYHGFFQQNEYPYIAMLTGKKFLVRYKPGDPKISRPT